MIDYDYDYEHDYEHEHEHEHMGSVQYVKRSGRFSSIWGVGGWSAFRRRGGG